MNLTVRNIPKEVIEKLRQLAKSSRRSLNNEILVRLEESVSEESTTDTEVERVNQIDVLRKVTGTWIDERETEEIITDIYSHRTLGRPVEL